MAIQIITGKKYHILTDLANKVWSVISFWTKASDVEFNDGKTAQTKLGAIDGITSDLNGESETIAASIKAVNKLNNNLGGYSFGETADGKPGYRKPGADTVIPFREIKPPKLLISKFTTGSGQKLNLAYKITEPSSILVIITGFGYNSLSLKLNGNIVNPIAKIDDTENVQNHQYIYYLDCNAKDNLLADAVPGSYNCRVAMGMIFKLC